jgi:DNA processing protein
MAAMEVALGSQARAWTTLALACGLSARRALALADAFGGAEAVVRADPARLAAHRVGAETAGAIATARDGLADLLRSLEHDGVSIVTWADGDYPSRLREIPDPPLALFVRGEVADLDRPAVAIVGARRASGYGRRVAEELGRDLAGAGLVVVSGLAAGIDAAAHRGALAAGGRTVAVLGTGIDRVYPPWHRDLADEISGSGALVTEFGPGEPPRPGHFPQRNRIVSGLTVATVVVEAGERSGSLITARHALEQNRAVFAVPGPLGPSRHAGPHRLIREGAVLVRSADDVLAEIAPGLLGGLEARRAAREAADLAPAERALLDALQRDELQLEVLINVTGMPSQTALETLLALELRGLVVQSAGKRFRGRAA